MKFYDALKQLDTKDNVAIRMIGWNSDVLIDIQRPDEFSKMSAPYLYVRSRFGMVPWLPTQIEMFSDQWEVVEFEKK